MNYEEENNEREEKEKVTHKYCGHAKNCLSCYSLKVKVFNKTYMYAYILTYSFDRGSY